MDGANCAKLECREGEKYDSRGWEIQISEEEMEKRCAMRVVGKRFGLGIFGGEGDDCDMDDTELGVYDFIPYAEKRWDLIWCHEVGHREVAHVFGTTGKRSHLPLLIVGPDSRCNRKRGELPQRPLFSYMTPTNVPIKIGKIY